MREDTSRLIDRLASEAKPVQPLQAPLLRAGLLLAAVLTAMAAFAGLNGHAGEALTHIAHLPYSSELIGAALAGISAIVAAVMLAIPGRSPNWVYAPVPGLILWLIGGGLECQRQIAELGYVPTTMFASRDCFAFILGAGLPTAVAVYLLLRRSLAINTTRVLALAGLGAALLAATLLQFTHAHGTNPVDFGTHVVAVALLTFFAILLSRVAHR
jgi:hypothetical protein